MGCPTRCQPHHLAIVVDAIRQLPAQALRGLGQLAWLHSGVFGFEGSLQPLAVNN